MKKERKDTDWWRFCLGFAGEKYTVKSTLIAEKCREDGIYWKREENKCLMCRGI